MVHASGHLTASLHDQFYAGSAAISGMIEGILEAHPCAGNAALVGSDPDTAWCGELQCA
jgi:hypothetical protein